MDVDSAGRVWLANLGGSLCPAEDVFGLIAERPITYSDNKKKGLFIHLVTITKKTS